MIDPLLLSATVAGIAGGVWLIRLEGRVNSHDTLFVEREKLVTTQHQTLVDRLVRIETKLDQSLKLNGSNRL